MLYKQYQKKESNINRKKLKKKESYQDKFFYHQLHLMGERVQSSVYLRQIGAGQDMAFDGGNEKVKWIVAGDGHGYGKVVEEARKFNWNQLENKDLSVQEILQEFLDNEKVSGPKTFDDGMSLSVVRVFFENDNQRKIELSWIGDSSIWVSKLNTNSPLFFNDPGHGGQYVIHSSLKDLVTKKSAVNFEILDDENAKAVTDFYFHFQSPDNSDDKEVINMTGAIGHRKLTYHPFFTQNLLVESDEKIIIRVASDGLWNVLHPGDRITLLSNPEYSSEKLSGIALKRWNQFWNYDPNLSEDETFPIQKFTPIGDTDDIAVGTMLLNL